MAVTPWGELYPLPPVRRRGAKYSLGNIWDGDHERRRDRTSSAPATPTRVRSARTAGPGSTAPAAAPPTAYHATGSINGVYEYGCELFKKRIECAIMLQAYAERGDDEWSTPICDFVRDYCEQRPAAQGCTCPDTRARGALGCEALDITEVPGADDLALCGRRASSRDSEEQRQRSSSARRHTLLLHRGQRPSASRPCCTSRTLFRPEEPRTASSPRATRTRASCTRCALLGPRCRAGSILRRDTPLLLLPGDSAAGA